MSSIKKCPKCKKDMSLSWQCSCGAVIDAKDKRIDKLQAENESLREAVKLALDCYVSEEHIKMVDVLEQALKGDTNMILRQEIFEAEVVLVPKGNKTWKIIHHVDADLIGSFASYGMPPARDFELGTKYKKTIKIWTE
jgi:hypothetical protein